MSRRSALPPTLWLALAFAGPLAVYAFSLFPSIQMWDTGEAQTVPYILGIAHRTGFPLFVLLGWAFSHAFAIGNVAWRISLMSAITMSVAAACLYLGARALALPPFVALGTSGLFAFTEIVWTRATRGEILSLAVMWAALGYLAAIRWSRDARPRDAYLLAASVGCGIATHPIELMLLPGLAVLFAGRWRQLTRRTAAIAAGLAIAPLLAYAYIPLRSAYIVAHRIDPTTALGLVGQPIWNYNDPSTPAKFLAYIASTGGQVGGGLSGMFAPQQWVHVISDYGSTLVEQFGFLTIVLAFVGLALCARDRPWITAGLVLSAFLPVAFVLNYDESDTGRYFLASYWVVALLAGYGSYRLAAGYFRDRALPATLAAGLVLLAIAGWYVKANDHLFDQRDDRGGEDFIGQIQRLTPDDAIVVATWLTATTLGYAANVQHALGHRLIVTASPDQYATYYTAWLRRRPIFVRTESPFKLPKQKNLKVTVSNAISELYRVEIRRRSRVSPRSTKRKR